MCFTDEEKIRIFDKISKNYFERNFGNMSKSDFEILLFSEYIEHCIKNHLKYDDYSLSKELGITQNRVRSLKERKELRYPYEDFDWKKAFVELVENAKYDSQDHLVKMIVDDINVMQEVRNFIEVNGWYDECSLNKKLLRIPLDCFAEICCEMEEYQDVFSEKINKDLRAKLNENDSAIKNFLSDFTKDGFKSFLMSASKEVLLEVLKLLPFGGAAGKGFELLAKAIAGMG